MSKQERLSWTVFLGVSACSAWLGWVLWSAWPDMVGFGQHERALTRPLMLGFYVLLGAIVFIRDRWRPHEPLADERDLEIMHSGNTQGFVALALMNVVLGAVLSADNGLLGRLDADWLRYLLLLEVGLALCIAHGYRLVRYRIG